MSTFRTSRLPDFTHSPKSEVTSEYRLSAEKHPHTMTSKEQQTVSSSEHATHETTNRSVPIFLDPPPPLELHPMRLTAAEPVMARWDSVTPHAVTPERSLHRMDQELQRLAGEMNRMWSSQPVYRHHDLPRGWTQPLPHADSELTRLWNQAALDREAELQRLWNQSALLRHSSPLALPPAPEAPRGFVRLNAAPQPLLPSSSSSVVDLPWGAAAHADSWRKKENFFIDNPLVKASDGRSQFRLEFDLRQFNAGEIEVRTDGHVLTVQAKHEESGERKQARREYFRQCSIPQDVDLKLLVSQLSPSGILSVSAPLKAGAGESVMKSIDVKPM